MIASKQQNEFFFDIFHFTYFIYERFTIEDVLFQFLEQKSDEKKKFIFGKQVSFRVNEIVSKLDYK
jgi:hypothetical protein